MLDLHIHRSTTMRKSCDLINFYDTYLKQKDEKTIRQEAQGESVEGTAVTKIEELNYQEIDHEDDLPPIKDEDDDVGEANNVDDTEAEEASSMANWPGRSNRYNYCYYCHHCS